MNPSSMWGDMNVPKKEYSLQALGELRVEVKASKVVFITLRSGGAEIFGSDLTLGEKVALKSQNFAVFTWQGCRVEMATDPARDQTLSSVVEMAYESDETPMTEYLNIHHTLDNCRTAARNGDSSAGPRTLVVGPTDVGKSTLCRLLLNYAVRSNWTPTMIDLDIGQGGITVPGSIGATPIEAPVDIEEGLPVEVPLVYFYGHTTPSDHPELYKALVDRLGQLLDDRAKSSPQTGAAGMMINTMGWVEGLGFQLLMHTIVAMRANIVLVVGQDRLLKQLQATYQGPHHVDFVKVSKSGGVVTRQPPYRKSARISRVKEYFYGVKEDLNPISMTMKMDNLHIYKVGGAPKAPTSALPIGASAVADPLRITKVTNCSEVLHCLLAVSHADDPEQLLSVNVAGFLYVTDVDIKQNQITYLQPSPGPLPGKFLMMGSFQVYFE
ncbi:TPA: hypothetical protein ACH3X3_000674 [Trebouxia sp. C0006]